MEKKYSFSKALRFFLLLDYNKKFDLVAEEWQAEMVEAGKSRKILLYVSRMILKMHRELYFI